ncbi:outer membrane protein assembly factor BamA [candidate division CSSED10-310 bacterium]|uniref:Outer membrane protein assembly factor BamA n=1 Tax=candidate division CSSED10-310 bacterium TaxID=2855610 RepID=A0ABV6YY28_UNCC1
MKSLKKICLALIIVISITPFILAQENQDQEIVPDVILSIQVVGNNAIEKSTILFNIKSKEGQRLATPQIREDIKNLFKTGFFEEVSVDTRQEKDGVIVTFIVREKPIVTKIEIIGNKKISSDTLEKELNVKLKRIFDPTLVKKDEEKIRAQYIERGYNDVEVKSESIKTSSNTITIIYKIIEGAKVRIAKIEFKGNKSFTNRKLRKVLENTRKYWYLSWLTDSGKFNQEEFEADLELLREFYENHGFAEIEIGEPDVKIYERQVSKRKIIKEMKIQISLNEGEQFHIGNIEIEGNSIFNDAQILRIIQKIDVVEGTTTSLFKLPEPKFRHGELFSRKALQEAMKDLYELYGTKGHIFANILPSRQIIRETKTIDYSIRINEGKQAYINKIEFTGNQRTRDKVIRREMRISEGDIFNSSKLRYSLSRLTFLGYVENLKPEFNPSPDDPQKLDITIGLTDERRTELQVGGGFSSVDKVFFAISFAEHNFLGYGQEVQLSLTSSNVRNEYSIRFVEDYLLDTKNALTVSVYRKESRYYEDFDRMAVGGELGLGRHFYEFIFGRISFQYEMIEIYNVADDARDSIRDAEGQSITSSFVFFLQRDRRNNRRDPSRGTRHYVVYEIATKLFSGDNIYYKMTYDGSLFFPLLEKLIYAFHTKIQYSDSYGGNILPAFEYYILGGERSVRGFQSASIGPRATDFEERVIGGNKVLQFNHELIIPVADPLRLVFFYDQGDVYATNENFDVRTLRESVGVELRIFVPMFWVPIRFIWGYNLHPYEFEEQSEFQFTIGSIF